MSGMPLACEVDGLTPALICLSIALCGSTLLWLWLRRPVVSALAGSVLSMIALTLLRPLLPDDWRMYIRVFINHAFFCPHCGIPGNPCEAAYSVAFHIGLPVGAMLGLDRIARKRFPPHCCQHCGYDLTGNVSGICPECGQIIPCPGGKDAL